MNNPIRYIDFQGMGAQEKGKKSDPPKSSPPKAEMFKGFEPRYSGSPVSVTGTLKGKWLGGKFGFSSGKKEIMVSGALIEGSLSGTVSDKNETKGTISIFTGEMKAKMGNAGLDLKLSGAQGEATINEDGEVSTGATAGTVEGKLAYADKGASVSKSAWNSNGPQDADVNLVGGDNKVGSNEDKTTITAGASAAEVSVTVHHNNAGNFLADMFELIGLAVFGDLNQNNNEEKQ